MNKPVQVTIAEPYDSFVESQLESGEFKSAQEVVEAGLKLLKEEQARIEWLLRMPAPFSCSAAPDTRDTGSNRTSSVSAAWHGAGASTRKAVNTKKSARNDIEVSTAD